MNPTKLGKKYDKIAGWWLDHHRQSDYGVAALKKALQFVEPGGSALDVGCGVGGRLINLLHAKHFQVTGLDVSQEMISIAQSIHPQDTFIHSDICHWHAEQSYDFILAWDSLFHLPLTEHPRVLTKLCQLLTEKGVFLYRNI